MHSSGPDLSKVLVGASTPDEDVSYSNMYCSKGFNDCPDGMVCGDVTIGELLCESDSDCPRSAFCDDNFGVSATAQSLPVFFVLDVIKF